MSIADHREWAFSEFGEASIADLRNVKRLVSMGAAAAYMRGGRVTEVFIDSRERDAAYDFLENSRIPPLAIGHASAVATARRAAREPFVWLAVDGTSLTLPDSTKSKGMGRLGSGKKGTGTKVITCVVIDPDGVPLGTGDFSWWTRTGPANKQGRGKARVANAKRAVRDKETQYWVDAIDRTRETFADEAPHVKRWWVMDREADSITLLHKAVEWGDWMTIRSNVNRRLIREESGGFGFVREALAAQPVVNEFELTVPQGHKRQARRATMHVSCARVRLDMRENWSKKRRPLTVNAIWVREVGTNPPNEEPIEWVLYTNHSVDALEDLHLVVYSYMQRWRVEDFHRTWKSGACRVEDTRLGKVDNVIRWASILAPVAARAERLKILSRTDPQQPADAELSTYELKAIRALKRRYGGPSGTVPKNLTLGQAVLYIAVIGGYTGASSGGPPGSTTIARGLERVRFVAEGMELADESHPEPTHRKASKKRT